MAMGKDLINLSRLGAVSLPERERVWDSESTGTIGDVERTTQLCHMIRVLVIIRPVS
jgi:hypothetical protein